jgi:hypothetical protein
MKTPINYLGRMIREPILMMSGVMACLVIGFDMVTKGADLLEWMIFVLAVVCMVAGILGILDSWSRLQREQRSRLLLITPQKAPIS